MRLLQIATFYPAYLADFDRKHPIFPSYEKRLEALLDDRFNATHILEPIQKNEPWARLIIGNDLTGQQLWAKSKNIPFTTLHDVALAQIEEHQPDVVYTLNPKIFDSNFVRRLPGCVKKTICWLAAPQDSADLSAFDLRVCNFPHILEGWRAEGQRAEWLSPAHDPEMDSYAANTDRPIDIAFAGQFSPNHKTRNALLESIAALGKKYKVAFALLHPRFARLGDRGLASRIILPWPHLPSALRKVAIPAAFGRSLYQLFGQSKIVFNAAIEMAGQYRGNMRCFEALGCGAGMVSDDGIYPEHFSPGAHFLTFTSPEHALEALEELLRDPGRRQEITQAGRASIKQNYSKRHQWETFQQLVHSI